MMFGFGSGETDLERSEGRLVDEFLDAHANKDDHFVTKKLVSDLGEFLKKRRVDADDAAAQYKLSPNPPERYSTFYCTILHDASNIVVVFRFMHINRRHPMSSDGWAAINTKFVRHWEWSH